MQEIEVKFAISEAVRQQLLDSGAESHGRRHISDVRYDDIEGSLIRAGKLLRLRRIQKGDEVRHEVAVKAPADTDDGPFRKLHEYEFSPAAPEAFEAALAVLGYQPFHRSEKRRERFISGAVELMLDETPMGWFLEIEGEPEDIKVMCAQLNLDLAESTKKSYGEIFACVRKQVGIEEEDMLFEAVGEVDQAVVRSCI